MGLGDADHEAGVERFRPIMMTTLVKRVRGCQAEALDLHFSYHLSEISFPAFASRPKAGALLLSFRLNCILDRGRSTFSILPYLPITKAIDNVIVHHSNRLHIGINGGRTDKAESPALKVLAESLGFGRYRWNLPHSLPAV